MRIIRYKLASLDQKEWDFDSVEFGRINLLVGDSGTGKSRFINTIINFIKQITSDKITYKGDWDIDFEIEGNQYRYKLVVNNSVNKLEEMDVIQEELIDNTLGTHLFKRDNNSFTWKGGELPKLSRTISAISLLKNEDEIKPLYNNLTRVVARRFFTDELNQNFLIGTLAPQKLQRILNSKDAQMLLNENIDFHNKMNILKTLDSAMYDQICSLCRAAFPFIQDTSTRTFAQVFPGISIPIQNAPVFCIRERQIDNWIPVNDISSGMQKLFLLILDVFLMKNSGILLIDEYENSLGINAINFLPDLIHSISEKCQFIITSHHPYIINTIPVENWYVFHRSGLKVKIKNGAELKEKYKHSKQEQFVQLINDPFYTGGIE